MNESFATADTEWPLVGMRRLLAALLVAIASVSCNCEIDTSSVVGRNQDSQPVAEKTAQAEATKQGDQPVAANHPPQPTAVPLRAAGPRPGAPRIAPVPKDSWTEEQQKLLAPFAATNRLYNVFTTMANHPDLARDWLTFATHVLRNNSLPPRDREILILRIGWLCRAEYEWAQHVPIGQVAGLTDDDVRRISEGPTAAGLAEHDRLLLVATDELRADACLSDATWKGLAKTYNQQQMMDLVFTVGQYNLVSMALNSFGVQLDDGLRGFSE